MQNIHVYDPQLWDLIHSRHRAGYTPTGYAYSWVRRPRNISFTVDTSKYSAEPSSLYAFTYFFKLYDYSHDLDLQAETITISVKARFGNDVWGSTEQVTTIDIPTINSALLDQGYDELQITDILFVGDTPRRPAMVMRDGGFLDVVVPVTYEGVYPGATGLGQNIVAINYNAYEVWRIPGSDYIDVSYYHAQRHTFRRL